MNKINWQDFTKQVVEKLNQNENRLRQWKNSQRFYDVLLQLKLEAKNKSLISSNEYVEFLFGDVSNEEFNTLFEVLFNDSNNIKINNSSSFDESYLIYDDLVFEIISGQGSILTVLWPEYKDPNITKLINLANDYYGPINCYIEKTYDDEFIVNLNIKSNGYQVVSDDFFWEKIISEFSSDFFSKYVIVLNPYDSK